MKFKVTMKDPDTLHDAIADAVKESINSQGLTPEEGEALREVRAAWVARIASKWFEYGEYLTVEIDTDAGTCAVVPV